MSTKNVVKHAPAIVSGLLVGGLAISYASSPALRDFLQQAWATLTSNDEPRITRWIAQFGWRGPLLLVAAMIAQLFLVVVPSWLLLVVSMLAYGPVWGSVLSMVASAIAAGVGYVVGRYVGDVVVRDLVGDATERRFEGWVKRYGFWAVALARMSPFISGDAVSLVSGLSRMAFGRFLFATLLGVLPLVLGIAWVGRDTEQLKQAFVYITLAGLVAFVGYWLWKRSKR